MQFKRLANSRAFASSTPSSARNLPGTLYAKNKGFCADLVLERKRQTLHGLLG